MLQFAATMAGSLALLIGAYVVMLGLIFTPYIIFDWGLPATQALRESWNVMRGHKVQLLVLFFALFAVNMLGLLTCGAGMLVTIPVSVGAMTLFYDRIARPGNVFLHI